MYESNTFRKKLGWIQKQYAARSKKQEAAIIGPMALYSRSRRLTRSIGSDIAIIFYASLGGRFIYIKSNLRRSELHKTSKDLNFRNTGQYKTHNPI